MKGYKCPNCRENMDETLLEKAKEVVLSDFENTTFQCPLCKCDSKIILSHHQMRRVVTPPKFVKLSGGTTLRLKTREYEPEVYYRDAGDWGVEFIISQNGEITINHFNNWLQKKRMGDLEGKELVETTEEEYREDNQGYLEDEPFTKIKKKIYNGSYVSDEEMEEYRIHMGIIRPEIFYHISGAEYVKQKNGLYLDTTPHNKHEKKTGHIRFSLPYEQIICDRSFSEEKPKKKKTV